MPSLSVSAPRTVALTLLAVAVSSPGQSPTTQPQTPLPVDSVRRLPACTATQLLLSTDSEAGNFDGMSHSGTLLVLRNNGPAACRLVPMAQLTLLDAVGKPLTPFSATAPGARGMHPGPVVLPIAVAAGAELTATLRWISGPVFTDSLCLDPATIALTLGSLTLQSPLAGHLCGERGKGVSAELSRFTPDPIVVAAPRSQP